MMPGRPVFLLLPVLGVPIAWLYERLAPGSPGRAGAQVLLLVSAAITLTIVVLSPSVQVGQDGDGSSALLVWMSPAWQLWREAPSYVAGVTRASSMRVLLWLFGFAAVAWLLARRPAVLIVDEPTRGIDVATKAEVHRLLSDLAADGVAVLMISSELPEVLGMADRIVVLFEGRVSRSFMRAEADEDAIMRAATGLAEEEAA